MRRSPARRSWSYGLGATSTASHRVDGATRELRSAPIPTRPSHRPGDGGLSTSSAPSDIAVPRPIATRPIRPRATPRLTALAWTVAQWRRSSQPTRMAIDPGVGPEPVAGAEHDVQLGGPGGRVGQGPGVGHGHVGVVGAVDHQQRPALEEGGVLGRVQDRELLGPGLDEAGKPGVRDRRRSGGSARAARRGRAASGARSAGVPRQATPGHPLVARRPGAAPAPRRTRSRRRGGATPRGSRSSARKARSSSQPSAEKSPADSPAPRSAAVTTRQPDSRVSRSASAG